MVWEISLNLCGRMSYEVVEAEQTAAIDAQ